jgi:DNA (cytosine-5)-methyltransferase 1
MGDTASGGRRVIGDAALTGSGRYSISPSWAGFDVIQCRDGKARRVESGTFPLADGISGRVGLLRGYGNAIVPQLAAEFINAAEEALV